MITFKPITMMEKCFMDEAISSKTVVERISGLKEEECAFQLAYTSDDPDNYPRMNCVLKVDSPISEYINIRQVEQVPVRYPCRITDDEDYLRREAGLYPDLLSPLDCFNHVFPTYNVLKTLYVTVKIPASYPAGDYPMAFALECEDGSIAAEAKLTFHCVNAVLPEQTMKYTNWFHSDCIANYYNLETFSEKHWEYIGKFIRTAAANGMNTILTPVFTPPLDTAIGHERRTIQLVDVEKTADGWSFGFEKLERWVKLCLENGIEFFEISHLYSQWGAVHAPKIMGRDESGEYKHLFGWETDSTSAEYCGFLRAFLKALIAECKKLGIDNRIMFHISDEPNREQADDYKAAREQIADLLDGYRVMDAMSHFELYEEGVVECPIPCSSDLGPFLEADIPDLWTYYCCGTRKGVSNRLIAMSMERARVIGLQFWKYDIKGFLQWGYNFYSSCGSCRPIDPYLVTDGDYWVPAGDCFVVYPGPDGNPLETLHLKAFTFALQDTRALQLACSLSSKEEVTAIIEKYGTVTFFENPKGNNWLEKVREEINELIEKRIG